MDAEDDNIDELIIKFEKEWARRLEPKLRHIIDIRRFIINGGNIVRAEDITEYIMNEYGFDAIEAMKMLVEFERRGVIIALRKEDGELEYINNNEDLDG